MTLVEIMIGLAIMGLLAAGISQAIYQVVTINASGNARMNAMKQVEYAIDFLRQDAVMAQNITPQVEPDSDAVLDGFPLEFAWTEWGTDMKIEVTYVLNGTDLERHLKEITGLNPPALGIPEVVAKNVVYIEMLNRTGYTGGEIRIKIVSRVPGLRAAEESRTFDILPRPVM